MKSTKKTKSGKPALSLVPPAALNPFDAAEKAFQQGRIVFDIDFGDITRCKGGVANGDKTDPVVYGANAELGMRKLIAYFGFDRLPLTWGELNGTIDYCDRLVLARADSYPESFKERMRAASRYVYERNHPGMGRAIDAFTLNDIEALRRIHTEDKVMELWAKKWKEFEEEFQGE